MMIAVLALAGCGEGKHGETNKAVSAPAQSQPVKAAATPQWDVQVQGETPQAVSDLTGWLIEHGFISYVTSEGGKQRILIGPFDSQAEAQAKKAELTERLVRAKKRDIESTVVEHGVAQ